jgi:hypothetical protein
MTSPCAICAAVLKTVPQSIEEMKPPTFCSAGNTFSPSHLTQLCKAGIAVLVTQPGKAVNGRDYIALNEAHKALENGHDGITDFLLDIIEGLTEYLELPREGFPGCLGTIAKLTLQFFEDDTLRTGYIPVSIICLTSFFCSSVKVTPTRCNALIPVSGSFKALPSWIALVLVSCPIAWRHVKHGLRGLRKCLLADVGEGEQQVFTDLHLIVGKHGEVRE